MDGTVYMNDDGMRIEYDNGNAVYFDEDGFHGGMVCGVCGEIIGYVNESHIDEAINRAVSRICLFDGAYICDDCYNKIKTMRSPKIEKEHKE